MEEIMRKTRRTSRKLRPKLPRRAKKSTEAGPEIPYASAYGDPKGVADWSAAEKLKRKKKRLSILERQRGRARRVRGWIDNLPLRASFSVHVVLYLLIALLLTALVISFAGNQRSYLEYSYEAGVGGEVQYTYVYNGIFVAIIEDGSVEELPMTAWDRIVYAILSAMEILAIPVIFVGCIILAAVQFYRKKLKRPIAELQAASARIGENDLTFNIKYENKDEMGQLCTSFEGMRSALLSNNREMWRQMEERKRLNAAFSHDLRTPLTVLRGQTDMLKKYLPEGKISEEKAIQTLGTMSNHIDRLERYVQAMNSMQKLTDAAVERIYVNREAFSMELRDVAVLLCKEKALHFTEAGEAHTLYIDPNIVMRVYENLLTNAVRFAKSQLWVDCLYDDHDGLYCISVADDGPGFSEKDLRLATEPFYKAKENVYDAHFGLGLHISRILAERHGGKLEISNRTGGLAGPAGPAGSAGTEKPASGARVIVAFGCRYT